MLTRKTLPEPRGRAEKSLIYDEALHRKMKKSPGTWHRVETRRSRPSHWWAKKRFPGLEVSTRLNDDDEYDVWARYA